MQRRGSVIRHEFCENRHKRPAPQLGIVAALPSTSTSYPVTDVSTQLVSAGSDGDLESRSTLNKQCTLSRLCGTLHVHLSCERDTARTLRTRMRARAFVRSLILVAFMMGLIAATPGMAEDCEAMPGLVAQMKAIEPQGDLALADVEAHRDFDRELVRAGGLEWAKKCAPRTEYVQILIAVTTGKLQLSTVECADLKELYELKDQYRPVHFMTLSYHLSVIDRWSNYISSNKQHLGQCANTLQLEHMQTYLGEVSSLIASIRRIGRSLDINPSVARALSRMMETEGMKDIADALSASDHEEP